MILTELIREAIQFGAHHKEDINNKGYDSYNATMKKFFDKHQVENLSIHGVVKSLNSEMQVGDDVLYVGKEVGTILKDRNVQLRDGTLIASLDTQRHKFRKIL